MSTAEHVNWQHRLETIAFKAVMGLFRMMGRDRASAFGGALFRVVGPRISRHKKALASMARALPELPEAEREAAMMEMWDNLGRVAGEYAHLDTFTSLGDDADISVEGHEVLAPFADSGKAAIFVSGHFANWELSALAGVEAGVEVAAVYRAPNNPAIDAWITRTRQANVVPHQVPKGPAGARELVKCLRSGISLCLLADQKMNDGIESDFFGRPAMSPAAPATMALRYDVPIIPVSFVRVEDTRFAVKFWPPLEFEKTGDMQADVAAVTGMINRFLEDCIRAHPGQWLWLHRRWKD